MIIKYFKQLNIRKNMNKFSVSCLKIFNNILNFANMFFAHRQAVKRNLINFDNNSHTLMNQYENIIYKN